MQDKLWMAVKCWTMHIPTPTSASSAFKIFRQVAVRCCSTRRKCASDCMEHTSRRNTGKSTLVTLTITVIHSLKEWIVHTSWRKHYPPLLQGAGYCRLFFQGGLALKCSCGYCPVCQPPLQNFQCRITCRSMSKLEGKVMLKANEQST